MARHIAVGILVGLLGLYLFAAPIDALPESTSQGTSVTTLDLQQATARTFLQNIQRLETLNKWGQPVHGLRMSIVEDDEDDAELSNNPDWRWFPLQSKDCELGRGGPYCDLPAMHGNKIHLLLEIRNDGDQDVTIGTGGGCGIRATGVTSGVEVSLTDSGGKSLPLHFLGIGPPYQPGCAGAMTVFSVTTGPGRPFAAVLDLGKYMNLSDNQSYAGMYHLPAGTYAIQAQLELRTFGTLSSNTIQVRFDSDFSIFYFPKHVAP